MALTENFPFIINGIVGQQWTSSVDSNLRILFGMRGSWQLHTKKATYQMSAEDVLVLNAFEIAQAQATSPDAVLFLIEIHREEIENQLDMQWTPIFDCNSMAANQFTYRKNEFNQLREKLLACIASFYEVSGQNSFGVYEKFFSLLNFLKSHFQKGSFHVPDDFSEKIQRVLTIIHLNYTKPLTLQQIADETFLSYHYLSHKFKAEVGVSFKKNLTTYRLKKAATALKISDHSILKIALENGFTNSKAFHQAFKEHYGTTPREYRLKQTLPTLDQTKAAGQTMDSFELLDIEAVMLELSNYIIQKDSEDFLEPKQLQKQITLHQATTARTVLPKILNIGHCSNWLRNDCRQALCETCQELNIDYLRFSDVLIENSLAPDSFGILPSQFQLIRLLRFTVEQHLTPIIHFKLNPEFISSLTNGVSIKEAFQTWLTPRLEVLQQLVDEFGEISNTWHLEFDIDPFPPDVTEIFSMFYQQLNTVIHHPTIGLNIGALFNSPELNQLDTLLADLAKRHLMIDFIDYRSDPSHDYLWDETQQNLLENYQKYNLTTLKETLTKYHCSEKILLSEWNTLTGNGTTLRGTFFRSAIMLKDLLYLTTEIDGVGFWLNNEHLLTQPQPTSNGQDRLTLYIGYQLKRPAFFALQLFDKLKGPLLYQDDTICLTQQGQILTLLLLNPAYFNPAMSIDETYMQYQSQLINLDLLPINPGTYQIKTYSLDKDHGGIYNEMLQTSGLESIDQEVIDYLKRAILPKFEISQITVTKKLKFKELLSFNACRLIQIKRLPQKSR
ncbi:hypothetical protein FC83_GL001996 [Agrilactobacillus composti DSM 18527 = JCM 14202]|uniref:HTH araC/xylS-type domain-containing protein n=1 Tax=Agrilactobacillus composti DSM 18527 = JCM 14202 TaxID=1423734 RepID=X0PCY7_9LACO|nr:helix-turn-helix domain-containing protein [Agrilactobacillus composti]KRM34858.1 hypothetical protein FC83_GL001996 [Agrilactobacillus composti DSM 18527 = JCM 14202]GAF38724.1 hypothetical protein JCM14202_550 [Agrilactobacillus composti DSM 18527 = JCM 14202]